MDHTTALFDCAGRCEGAFERCTAQVASTADARAEILSNEFVRFRLWASNSGVFASGRASLDHRIDATPQLVDTFRLLLEAIHETLESLSPFSKLANVETVGSAAVRGETHRDMGAYAAMSPESLSSSSSAESEEKSEQHDTQDSYKSIADMITRLHRLSTAIRKSAIQYRASKFSEKRLEGDQKDDDDDDFERHVLWKVGRTLANKPSPNPDLETRLRRAICLRRQQILYQRKHQRKLAKRRPDKIELPARPASNMRMETPVIENKSQLGGSEPGDRQKGKAFTRSMTGTSNTGVEETRVKAYDVRSRESVPNLRSVRMNATLDFPTRPKVPAGAKELECEYCGIVLAKEIFMNDDQWRKHVMQDLSPYVCILDTCTDEPKSYRSVDAWCQHMMSPESKHPIKWYCSVCVSLSPEMHVFDSGLEYGNHLQKHHAESFTSPQLPVLIDMAARATKDPFVLCPFCKFIPPVPSNPKPGLFPAIELQMHVVEHLKELALLALPAREGDVSDFSNTRSMGRESKQARFDRIDGSSLVFDSNPPSPHEYAEMHYSEIEQRHMHISDRLEEWFLVFRSQESVPPVSGEPYPITVRNALFKKTKRNWRLQEYISRDDILEVLSLATVVRLMWEGTSSSIAVRGVDDFDIIKGIFMEATVLLAIWLTAASPLTLLLELLKKGLADSALPFAEEASILSQSDPSGTFQSDWRRILRIQYQFTPYTFHPSAKLATLAEDVVLPIHSNILTRDSAFSTIHKVYVDSKYNRLNREPTRPLTLKRFRSKSHFLDELAILQLLRPRRHDNIVEFLSAWTQGGEQCILFPFALSLSEFMLQTPDAFSTDEIMLHLTKQMLGLAAAVSSLHLPALLGELSLDFEDLSGPLGRFIQARGLVHCDINPQNIFVFPDPRAKREQISLDNFILKIGGFGSAQEIRSMTEPKRKNVEYSAPEREIIGSISYRYDTWSLGCTFLEILIWATQGYVAVQEFAQQRLSEDAQYSSQGKGRCAKFWVASSDRADVSLKPVVRGQLDCLGDFLPHSWVRLFQILQGMLMVDVRSRLDAGGVAQALRVLAFSLEEVQVEGSLFAVTVWAAEAPLQSELQIKAVLDTGAQRNLVSSSLAETLLAAINPEPDIGLLSADGGQLHFVGSIKVCLRWEGPVATKFAKIKCYVLKSLAVSMIIGVNAITKLALLETVNMSSPFTPIPLSSRTKDPKRLNESSDSSSSSLSSTLAPRVEASTHRQAAADSVAAASSHDWDTLFAGISAPPPSIGFPGLSSEVPDSSTRIEESQASKVQPGFEVSPMHRESMPHGHGTSPGVKNQDFYPKSGSQGTDYFSAKPLGPNFQYFDSAEKARVGILPSSSPPTTSTQQAGKPTEQNPDIKRTRTPVTGIVSNFLGRGRKKKRFSSDKSGTSSSQAAGRP